MIDEEGNEIDDDLWTDMMEAYAQGFVSGGGGASGPSEELENEAVQNFEKMELLYVDVYKSPKGFLRLLVQG